MPVPRFELRIVRARAFPGLQTAVMDCRVGYALMSDGLVSRSSLRTWHLRCCAESEDSAMLLIPCDLCEIAKGL